MNDRPECRLCYAPAHDQRLRAEHVYGGREEQNFWQCGECRAVYLFPPPTVEEEERFYREEFEAFMDERAGSSLDWDDLSEHVEHRRADVERRWPYIEPHASPGTRILEVGCSSGFMMDEFRDRGLDPVGVEPSEKCREYVRERGHTVFDSLESIAAEPPGESGFDIITHFFVFEHIRDPRSFMRETLALLAPGGVIVCEIPCVQDPLTALYSSPAFERFYWSAAHHFYYGPESLSYLLNELGCVYNLYPEQRYDLSNHITWLMDGKPGGQGRFDQVFGEELIEAYRRDLKRSWFCDTMFAVVVSEGA